MKKMNLYDCDIVDEEDNVNDDNDPDIFNDD